MLVVAALLSLLSVSCDELIWEGEGDCHTSYTVTFSYTMNMEYADAFAHYVDSVTLCAFTADSVLSYVKVSSGEELIANGQAMAVDDITPGYYTLVAWAMGEEAVAGCWSLPELVVGQTRLEDVTCCLNTTRGDTTEVSHDLTPLFHAMVTNADLTSVGYDGSRNVDMDLTKNTNVVRIVLQHLSGKDINVSDFTFDVVSDNGSMAHDNSLLEGGDIAYTPWATASTSAEVYSTTDEGEDTTSVYAAVAEMTTSRLVYGNATRLTVRNAQTGIGCFLFRSSTTPCW